LAPEFKTTAATSNMKRCYTVTETTG